MKNIFDIKLASNYQEVKFQLEVEEETEKALIERAINLVNMLGSEVKVNASVVKEKKPDELATDKQWEILKRFKLDNGLNPLTLTKSEANAIIKESMNRGR